MDVLTAISDRRAIRAYRDEKIDCATVEGLIDAAIRAPSARDLEPWAFVVLEGKERLREFSDEAKRALLAVSGGKAPAELRAKLEDPSFDIFYGAPVLLVICATGREAQAAEDCCLAAQNLMLAAHAAGLATCPIGLARVWLTRPETKQKLGIPEDLVPVFPVIIGHPAEAPARRGRRPPAIRWC